MVNRLTTFIFLLLISCSLVAQKESAFKKFCKLQRPEQWWVMTHPFIAKKALEATQKAKLASDKQLLNPKLDGYESGGQVDAFRHTYWMALMARNMKAKKALKLGIAHEKSNYLSFKKHKKEDGQFPDLASKKMDLYNNQKGLEIGSYYKKMSEAFLQKIIIDSILAGAMKIISRDSTGNYLNLTGAPIPKDSLYKWDNGKCLINSNYEK